MIDIAKLEAALRARMPGFERLGACERLSAGASRETYKLTAQVNGGECLLALRRSAAEASAMGEGPGLSAEASLFAAARRAGVPGPDVFVVLQPEDGLGAGFVMSWVEGETLGARIARAPAFDETRPKLARQCGEILARLHAVDVKAAKLDEVLERFTPQHAVMKTYGAYLELHTAQPVIDFTAKWLLANLPQERELALVHSDFRNGNLIVRPAEGVVAVLDWELAHIGDPMRDLGWLCTCSWRFGVPEKPVGGFGEYEDLFAGYEAVSGVVVDRAAIRFWEVFGSFWWSVGCLSMAQSWRAGAETSVERPAIGRRSSECQIDCVNLLIPGAARLPEEAPHILSGSDLPRSDELVASVRDFLRGEVASVVQGRNAFLARVAANSLDTVLRELALGQSALKREHSQLQNLLGRDGEVGELRAALCEAIRFGEIGLESEDLQDYLRDSALAQVMMDQPGYAGAVEALGRAVPQGK
jgi:aminoglycoside phosphotransferase (APT) family kinase protein